MIVTMNIIAFENMVDAASDKVKFDKPAGNQELDGLRICERWWFAWFVSRIIINVYNRFFLSWAGWIASGPDFLSDQNFGVKIACPE